MIRQFFTRSDSWKMYAYSAKRLLLRCRTFVPGLRTRHLREAMVGPLGYWQALGAYQLQALRANGLQPHHRVLDIGCGPLQGGIPMIRYLEPSRYFGVDVNPANLAEGYRQVAELRLTHKNPRLFHSKTFGTEELDGLRFDFIWASQILYYFDTTVLHMLFTLIANELVPNGKFLGDVLGPCDPEFHTSRHLAWCRRVKQHSAERFHELGKSLGLQARSLGRIEQFGYPRELNLRSNLLIEVTHAPLPHSTLSNGPDVPTEVFVPMNGVLEDMDPEESTAA